MRTIRHLLSAILVLALCGCQIAKRAEPVPKPKPRTFSESFRSTISSDLTATTSSDLTYIDYTPGFTWVIPGTNRVVAIEFREINTHMRVSPYYFHDREIYSNAIAVDPGDNPGFGNRSVGLFMKVHPTTRTQ